MILYLKMAILLQFEVASSGGGGISSLWWGIYYVDLLCGSIMCTYLGVVMNLIACDKVVATRKAQVQAPFDVQNSSL